MSLSSAATIELTVADAQTARDILDSLTPDDLCTDTGVFGWCTRIGQVAAPWDVLEALGYTLRSSHDVEGTRWAVTTTGISLSATGNGVRMG